MPSPEKMVINDHEYYVVIIPTAPVPFGGGLVFMPVDQVTPSDMPVENLISVYVSMGVSTPQFFKKVETEGATIMPPASKTSAIENKN